MVRNEVIVEVLAEGGGVILHGSRTNDCWQFSVQAIDQTPEILDEPWVENESKVVNTWPEALALLDKYPWHRLRPSQVHREFRRPVFDEVMARYKLAAETSTRTIDAWKVACGVGHWPSI